MNQFEQTAILLKIAHTQEAVLLSMRESIEKRGKNPDSSTYNFERAKMIGILSALDALKIDRTSFNWIF